MSASRFKSRWYSRRQLFNLAIPQHYLSWLFDPSSLTARLQRHCPGQFRVELISQYIARPRLDELSALGLDYGESALVRQVQLFCGEKAVVYARTVIPLKTLAGKQRSYANLGNRSLGKMLFADPGMRRGEVVVTRLGETDALFACTGEKNGIVWGRRSVFYVGNKPLLVSEYYLPTLFGQQRQPLTPNA